MARVVQQLEAGRQGPARVLPLQARDPAVLAVRDRALAPDVGQLPLRPGGAGRLGAQRVVGVVGVVLAEGAVAQDGVERVLDQHAAQAPVVQHLHLRLREAVGLARHHRVQAPVGVDVAADLAAQVLDRHGVVAELGLLGPAEDQHAQHRVVAHALQSQRAQAVAGPGRLAVAVALDVRQAGLQRPAFRQRLGPGQAGPPGAEGAQPQPQLALALARQGAALQVDDPAHGGRAVERRARATLDLDLSQARGEVGQVDEVDLAVLGAVERHAVDVDGHPPLVEAAQAEVGVAHAVAGVGVGVGARRLGQQHGQVLAALAGLQLLSRKGREAGRVLALAGHAGRDGHVFDHHGQWHGLGLGRRGGLGRPGQARRGEEQQQQRRRQQARHREPRFPAQGPGIKGAREGPARGRSEGDSGGSRPFPYAGMTQIRCQGVLSARPRAGHP